MSLNAKEDRQQVSARGVEAGPPTAPRATHARPALGGVTSLAGARGDAGATEEDHSRPTTMDRHAVAAAKPPSSLLDYRLVRVSSKLEDTEPAHGDTVTPAVGWSAARPGAESVRRDMPVQRALLSRRSSQAVLVLLALSLVSVLCIGAVLAL